MAKVPCPSPPCPPAIGRLIGELSHGRGSVVSRPSRRSEIVHVSGRDGRDNKVPPPGLSRSSVYISTSLCSSADPRILNPSPAILTVVGFASVVLFTFSSCLVLQPSPIPRQWQTTRSRGRPPPRGRASRKGPCKTCLLVLNPQRLRCLTCSSNEPVTQEIDRAAERRLRTKIDLMIMPTVCLLYLFCFIDRANIGEQQGLYPANVETA